MQLLLLVKTLVYNSKSHDTNYHTAAGKVYVPEMILHPKNAL